MDIGNIKKEGIDNLNEQGINDKLSSSVKFFKKLWFILWKDNSLKGWIFSIIFLFIFIKFIFFPALSLMTGTSLPLAIVESCSMYHSGNIISFNDWWDRHEAKYFGFDINKEDFETFELQNGFNKGDILFIIKAKPEKLKIGDIIIFNAGQKNPIIHRIINITNQDEEYIFSTIGDNNHAQISFEENIKEEQLIGKAIFKITPYLGWGKLIFFEKSKSEQERGFCTEN